MDDYLDEIAEGVQALGLAHEKKQRLGMSILTASGEIDGQHVRVDASWQGYRDRSHIVMQSALRPDLDLGLHVRRTLLSLGTGLPIAYPGFDAEHHVSADEPERAQLLLDDHVCKTITAVADLGCDIDLDDTRASVRQVLGFSEIRPTIHALTRVTAVVSERLRELSAAGPLEEAASAWQRYAAREHLQFSASPLVMEGKLASARTRRLGRLRYVTDVAVRLEEPLELGIALRPARRIELLWEIFAGADLQVGDAAFDRAFTIAARDATTASVVFDAEVRREILALREEGEIHLGDHGMSLRTEHAEDVPAAMDALRRILDRVLQNARNAGRKGPYR